MVSLPAALLSSPFAGREDDGRERGETVCFIRLPAWLTGLLWWVQRCRIVLICVVHLSCGWSRKRGLGFAGATCRRIGTWMSFVQNRRRLSRMTS